MPCQVPTKSSQYISRKGVKMRTIGEKDFGGHGGAGAERGRAQQHGAGKRHLRAGRPPPRARPRRLRAQHCRTTQNSSAIFLYQHFEGHVGF